MFQQYILMYNPYKGHNKHRRLKLSWGLEYIKLRIVLEGKDGVLISRLFKLSIMSLVEEILGKDMNDGGLVL